MDREIAALRQEYRQRSLDEESLEAGPIEQFRMWFDEALRVDVVEPNAMTLATVGSKDRPSARMVLLKDVGADGFTFFTNYRSRKAKELDEGGYAALVFWWQELERQVRVEGSVVRTSDEVSQAYFVSRPRLSQLGAWSSPQSSEVADRNVLEKELASNEAKFEGQQIPRPAYWGGYTVVPDAIEFWQGREGRLHDRIKWEKIEKNWQVKRLAP